MREKEKKNYIAGIVQVWLQYKIVLQVIRLVYGFLCCNTVVCIAELKAGLYCNRLEGLLESCVAIQCIVLQQAAGGQTISQYKIVL